MYDYDTRNPVLSMDGDRLVARPSGTVYPIEVYADAEVPMDPAFTCLLTAEEARRIGNHLRWLADMADAGRL